jgi:4-nitrophenyl phosphatase
MKSHELDLGFVGGLIIDMDGVLWQGATAFDGLASFFSTLRHLSIPFVLATNNASLTQQQYVDKLAQFGVPVSPEEILTSAMATARYLDEHIDVDARRAFVIGEQGLREPLEEKGFILTNNFEVNQPEKGIFGIGADLVISGLDRQLTWDKLATATLNIKAGATFVATNADTTLPTELGDVIGNGGTIAALTAATGITPKCIGKPESILYEYALDLLGTTKEQTVAIGDRLDTDILGAVNTGIKSIMVLTGISKVSDIDDVAYSPTWILEDINEISTVLLKSKDKVREK